MKKKVIAVLAGLVAAFIVIYVVEWIGTQVYPLPGEVDLSNIDELSAAIADAPAGALLVVVLAHVLGAGAGGWLAGRLSGSPNLLPAWIIGSILLAAGLMNLIMIPGHPVWFWVLDLLVYIPAAVAGYRISSGGTGDTVETGGSVPTAA